MTVPVRSWRQFGDRQRTFANNAITRKPHAPIERSDQEELVTVRNDRFVIPVRSIISRESRVAHGASSSGATVFISRSETIDANNELQSLREAEQREIAEILLLCLNTYGGAAGD